MKVVPHPEMIRFQHPTSKESLQAERFDDATNRYLTDSRFHDTWLGVVSHKAQPHIFNGFMCLVNKHKFNKLHIYIYIYTYVCVGGGCCGCVCVVWVWVCGVGVCGVVCVCVCMWWVWVCVMCGGGCVCVVCVGVVACGCGCVWWVWVSVVCWCVWCVCVFLMKQQFVVNHKIRQTETPAFLDDWVKTHLESRCCVHKNLLY